MMECDEIVSDPEPEWEEGGGGGGG